MAISPNIRKAAILLSTLPRDEAAAILRRLELGQVSAMTRAIAELQTLPGEETQAAVDDFRAQIAEMPHQPLPFEFLHGMRPEDLAALVQDELPQTIAVVLGELPRPLAVHAIGLLAADRQAAVIRRIAAMKSVDSEIVQIVASALLHKLQPAVDARRCA